MHLAKRSYIIQLQCNMDPIGFFFSTDHCVFAGKCVGYRNIRYFFGLLVHLTLGGFYASMLNIFFIWDALGGFTVRNAIAHIFPFLFWLFGSLDSKITFWTMLSVLSTCGGLFTLSLIFYHGSLLIKNQVINFFLNFGFNITKCLFLRLLMKRTEGLTIIILKIGY